MAQSDDLETKLAEARERMWYKAALAERGKVTGSP